MLTWADSAYLLHTVLCRTVLGGVCGCVDLGGVCTLGGVCGLWEVFALLEVCGLWEVGVDFERCV